MIAALFIFGLVLAVVPWLFVGANGLPGLTAMVLSMTGVLMVYVTGGLFVFKKLYRRAAANMALVRTGSGGVRVIRGGSIVVPQLHQLTRVSLEAIRLPVESRDSDGIKTRDRRALMLAAAFQCRVESKDDDIYAAARTLGERTLEPGALTELLRDRLIAALRMAAAERDFAVFELNRDDFGAAVKEKVSTELAQYGLTLEHVVISSLEQSGPASVSADGVIATINAA